MRILVMLAAGTIAPATAGAPIQAMAALYGGAAQSQSGAPSPAHPLPVPPRTSPTPAFVPPNPDVELQRHIRSRRPQPARFRGGVISAFDYPYAALRIGAQGNVTVRFLVGTSGRVTHCDILVSSGNADLDNVSCALITSRFAYLPAIGRNGRVTTEWRTQRIFWRLPEPPGIQPSAAPPVR